MSIPLTRFSDFQQPVEVLDTPSTDISEQIPIANNYTDEVIVLQSVDPASPELILVKPTSGESDAQRNMNFEYAVGHLIEDVARRRNLSIRYEKWKEMKGEPLSEASGPRPNDGKDSNPEYEITCLNNQNKVLVDAKNYDRSVIRSKQVTKLWGDMSVRQAKAGVLVVPPTASFSPSAWRKCQERGIYVLKVDSNVNKENSDPKEKGVSGHAHPSCYDSDLNRKYMDQILQAAVEDVSTPDVLLTKGGKIDRRSAFIRRGNDPNDGSIQYKKDGETVDRRTKVAKESDHYHNIRQLQKTRVLNYSQDEAYTDYTTRDNARKAEALHEKGNDQNNASPESQDNIEVQPNVAEEPTGRRNQNGTPDMRDTANREDPTLKVNGTPDERFAVNREVPATTGRSNPSPIEQPNLQANQQYNTAAREPQQQTPPQTQPNVAEDPNGRINQDGTPDMRDTANREDPTLKADGTPDMRFATNKENSAEIENSNNQTSLQTSEQASVTNEQQQDMPPQTQPNIVEDPNGRTNQDGTPDMRDTANREDPTLKADGAPDMRFASNREGPVPTENSNPSSNEQPISQRNEQGNSEAPNIENTASTGEGVTEAANSNLNATTQNNCAGPAEDMNASSGDGALDNNGGVSSTGPAEIISGSQQEGISSAQPNVADDPSGRASQDGTPDMRDTSNRADPTLKADGTPDMRFSANK